MAANRNLRRDVCAFIFAAIAASAAADARVTKIVISTTESPTYNGARFGSVGQYERLIGTATGELDPNDRHNAIIQDLQFAPRNANGRAEYTASFTLVKPIDMSKGNDRLFSNINNRGNRNFPYNAGGDPGDGFVRAAAVTNDLVKQGYLLREDGGRVFANAISDVLKNNLVAKDALAEKLLMRKALTGSFGVEHELIGGSHTE